MLTPIEDINTLPKDQVGIYAFYNPKTNEVWANATTDVAKGLIRHLSKLEIGQHDNLDLLTQYKNKLLNYTVIKANSYEQADNILNKLNKEYKLLPV